MEPEVALAVEKFVPVQELALADDHVRVDDCPLPIEVGFAVKLAVSPADTVIVAFAEAFPALPEQFTV